MSENRIISFLSQVAIHNNREWFVEHKQEYLACKQEFEAYVEKAIIKLSILDSQLGHLAPKDCCYRFYRDTRFSADKSPYKRHFGAYICTHGKKALHGGYYLHIQPDNSFLAFGTPWLPTNILTSCRNEILANNDTWKDAVENKEFINIFGLPNATQCEEDNMSARGFGITSLKTTPKGFPHDSEHINYLRMKDYCCWVKVEDNFFEKAGWEQQLLDYATIAKPMIDFINDVVDDYE